MHEKPSCVRIVIRTRLDQQLNNVSSFCKLLKTFLFGRIPGLRAPLRRFLKGALYKYPEWINSPHLEDTSTGNMNSELIHLSLFLCLCLSLCLSLSVSLSVSVPVPVSVSVCLCLCLSVCVSLSLSLSYTRAFSTCIVWSTNTSWSNYGGNEKHTKYVKHVNFTKTGEFWKVGGK